MCGALLHAAEVLTQQDVIKLLELKIPEGGSWQAMRPLMPVFLTYVLSFVNLGIYWNNHHHMLQATDRVNGKILWANLHLLFWLSLFPFTTGWVGENRLGRLWMKLRAELAGEGRDEAADPEHVMSGR